MAPRVAAVLGQCLSVDTVSFSEISLEDCALADDAVRAIAHALATNTACVSIDLKVLFIKTSSVISFNFHRHIIIIIIRHINLLLQGNNIRGLAVEALGRMLKENCTLKSYIFYFYIFIRSV